MRLLTPPSYNELRREVLDVGHDGTRELDELESTGVVSAEKDQGLKRQREAGGQSKRKDTLVRIGLL